MTSSAHIADLSFNERLELALKAAAYVVLAHGPAYIPILERLEAEIAKTDAQLDARVRADQILRRYTVAGGTKAIR